MDAVRMDKWLWAARFFKTRALATHACDLGRVEANGQHAKPARDVRAGDRLLIRTEGGEFAIEVLALSDIRGPAEKARTLYSESEASQKARATLAAEHKEMFTTGGVPAGRPSKRDRSQLDRLRGRS